MTTIVLLLISNIFMTFAWYGHLKYGHGWPIWQAIAVSWGIALFEYCLAVPANRLGYGEFTGFQLKIIQEVAGMTSVDQATVKVGDALSANIDKVDGIIATGYTPTVAIAQALTEYKSKDGARTIHAVGIDTDPIVMTAIKDGVMDGTIVQNPYGHGYLSLLLLQYLSEGYKPKADSYFVNAGFAFANKDNLETYSDDILKVTEQIKSELLDKYLEK